MESFFYNDIDSNVETNNILYNVLNSDNPKYLFLYFIIIVIITFFSSKISYNINILIGLIFCTLIILYIYTFKKYNTLTEKQIFKKKFDNINSDNQILTKYPKIVDFLFYLENFKSNNLYNYDQIVSLFENFCISYEYCLLDYNIIFSNYKNLIDQKISILTSINNFIFTTHEIESEKILLKQRIAAEKILDDLLNNLVLLYKKKIYYDGYNVNTKVVSNSNILPYNILYSTEYKSQNNLLNMSNLIFY